MLLIEALQVMAKVGIGPSVIVDLAWSDVDMQLSATPPHAFVPTVGVTLHTADELEALFTIWKWSPPTVTFDLAPMLPLRSGTVIPTPVEWVHALIDQDPLHGDDHITDAAAFLAWLQQRPGSKAGGADADAAGLLLWQLRGGLPPTDTRYREFLHGPAPALQPDSASIVAAPAPIVVASAPPDLRALTRDFQAHLLADSALAASTAVRYASDARVLLAKLPPDPNAVTTQAVRVAVRNTPGVRTARSVWKRFVEFLAERNVVIASYDDTPASVVTAAVMPSAQETSEHYAASSWDSGPVLAAFDTWMQHHDYAQKTRAKTVSYLRTALGLIKKPANSRDVADYHDSLAPPARGQLRVAWRLLVEFCVDVGVKPVPAACPARAHPGRGGVRVAMPLVVAQAVAFFGERASAAVLSRLKWGHVVV